VAAPARTMTAPIARTANPIRNVRYGDTVPERGSSHLCDVPACGHLTVGSRHAVRRRRAVEPSDSPARVVCLVRTRRRWWRPGRSDATGPRSACDTLTRHPTAPTVTLD
jgi:hypothetical protein